MAMSIKLPTGDGWLPYWFLFTSVLSIGNSIQAYLTLTYTRQVYARSKPSTLNAPDEVTRLQSRTFGTWTFLSSIIRLYAAYNISDPVIYQLAMWSYAIAWGHFVSEWEVFETAQWGKGLAGPVIVASASLCWMLAQYSTYVK